MGPTNMVVSGVKAHVSKPGTTGEERWDKMRQDDLRMILVCCFCIFSLSFLNHEFLLTFPMNWVRFLLRAFPWHQEKDLCGSQAAGELMNISDDTRNLNRSNPAELSFDDVDASWVELPSNLLPLSRLLAAEVFDVCRAGSLALVRARQGVSGSFLCASAGFRFRRPEAPLKSDMQNRRAHAQDAEFCWNQGDFSRWSTITIYYIKFMQVIHCWYFGLAGGSLVTPDQISFLHAPGTIGPEFIHA